jgi:hypothetical protein
MNLFSTPSLPPPDATTDAYGLLWDVEDRLEDARADLPDLLPDVPEEDLRNMLRRVDDLMLQIAHVRSDFAHQLSARSDASRRATKGAVALRLCLQPSPLLR